MSASLQEKPAIWVNLSKGSQISDISRSSWYQLFLGMEEEGIPFKLIDNTVELSKDELVLTAFDAAMKSPLSVGIACNSQEVVVHFRNLAKETPLFHFDGSSNQKLDINDMRSLGNNAARLVKGLPFKALSIL